MVTGLALGLLKASASEAKDNTYCPVANNN